MSVKRLIFVGGGSFARELSCWMLQSGKLSKFSSIAYISPEKSDLSFDYAGEISTASIKPNDQLILAIGLTKFRREAILKLAPVKEQFISFVHPSAIISENVKFGTGSVISPFCIVSNDTSVGDFLFMNAYSSIGHDCIIGENLGMSPYSAITGKCILGDDVYLGTHSTIIPGRKIGDNVKLSAGSVATKNVVTGGIVFGDMGKVIKL